MKVAKDCMQFLIQTQCDSLISELYLFLVTVPFYIVNVLCNYRLVD